MSTNKRKEAALFELIDKSTLRVPKSGGSLKIPGWWASRQNNTTEQNAEPAVASAVPIAPAGPVAGTIGQSGTMGNEPVVQTKLFDPPPSNVKPRVSASIRPPGKPVAASPVVRAPAVRSSVVPATVAPSAVNTVSRGTVSANPARVQDFRREVAPAASRPVMGGALPATRRVVDEPAEVEGRRTFAPMTASQEGVSTSGSGWTVPRGGRMPQVPTWALVATGAAILVVVLGLLMAFAGPGRTKAASPGVRGTNQDSDAGNISLPYGDAGRGAAGGSGSGGAMGGGRSQANGGNGGNLGAGGARGAGGGSGNISGITPGQAGRVFPVGTVPHNPTLFYLWIAQTPDKAIADRNAKFIAEHGVDVSVETIIQGGRIWYVVLSVTGFATMDAGDDFRAAVVKIGHEFPPELKIKRAWDDAYFQRVKPGTGR